MVARALFFFFSLLVLANIQPTNKEERVYTTSLHPVTVAGLELLPLPLLDAMIPEIYLCCDAFPDPFKSLAKKNNSKRARKPIIRLHVYLMLMYLSLTELEESDHDYKSLGGTGIIFFTFTLMNNLHTYRYPISFDSLTPFEVIYSPVRDLN